MRIANVSGRLMLVTPDDCVVDVSKITQGNFSSSIQECYERWDELVDALGRFKSPAGPALSEIALEDFGNPVPQPRQVFAIGLNYAEHAAEAGMSMPEDLTVFTKYLTSLAGPYGQITLPKGTVDWEVELVAVIGRGGKNITRESAWNHVAGLSAGQDLSERTMQRQGTAPQYSLAKSFPGFGPIGPLLVTPDEFTDPDRIGLSCSINGEEVQRANTSDMVFPVPEIIARLSKVTPLLPGDVIFTGTPSGVGLGHVPPRFLAPGDELVTTVEGVGQMKHHMV